MPATRYVCSHDHVELCESLDRIRAELEIPDAFPSDVTAAALAAAARGPAIPPGSSDATVVDRTDIELVTIDPPGSMDLDQAYWGSAHGSGWRVHYAIADVAAWVEPDGVIDLESQARGLTMYSPDARSPLHPPELSEDAASLLPQQDRQALLWTIDLDADGELEEATLERAVVRSRAKLSYTEAARAIEAGADSSIDALRSIGRLREAREVQRGAVSLQLAQQEVEAANGSFVLRYDRPLDVEGWNAQISLLAGIAGARLMLQNGIGILRTLPRPDDRTLRELRRTAKALDVPWTKSDEYADVVRRLDPGDPRQAALIAQSARGLRGAGYEAFDGDPPEDAEHSAIASTYAHVTAPLRRLGDRYANECVLAACSNERPPEWVMRVLPELPSILGRARNREGALDRMVVDMLEAAVLRSHVGERFRGVVTDVDEERDRSKIQLRDPAVVAYADGIAELGSVASVRLTSASIEDRRVRFELVDQT